MNGSVNIRTGGVEPIEVAVVDFYGDPIVGSTNIKLKIRRASDANYLDWSDNKFKSPGSVVQMLETLQEVQDVYSPGQYHLNTVRHPKGFNTSAVSNPNADDVYHFTAEEDGTSIASNLPQVGEVKVGLWVDMIDEEISSRATPSQVQDELRSIRLHTLVSVNPGVVPPAAGTYIRQILDKEDEIIVGGDIVTLKQSYGYDPTSQMLMGQVWVEQNNAIVAATSAVLTWYDTDGAAMFTLTTTTADPQNVFKFEKLNPGLTRNKSYYSVATVAMPGLGNVISAKGSLTIG